MHRGRPAISLKKFVRATAGHNTSRGRCAFSRLPGFGRSRIGDWVDVFHHAGMLRKTANY